MPLPTGEARDDMDKKVGYTEYHKQYYEKIVKTNPEKMTKRAAYHAEWQRKNKDKWNAYRKKRRMQKKLAESES